MSNDLIVLLGMAVIGIIYIVYAIRFWRTIRAERLAWELRKQEFDKLQERVRRDTRH